MGFLALALSSAGCATQFMGTAPSAAPGKTYVVGSTNSKAAVWLCPTGGGDCKEVDVGEN